MTTASPKSARTPSADAATFANLLAAMPFNPQQPTAKGLIPVLLRSSGHLLYLVGATAESRHVVTPEELQLELDHAAGHLDASTLLTATTLSSAAKDVILQYTTAVGHAKDSAFSWSEPDKARLLRDLANRAAGIGAFLDREFVGITDSDPGSAL